MLTAITQVGIVFREIWFIVLPITLYYIFRSLYGRHAAIKWSMSQTNILLEIIAPRDVEKSPQLMESFFAALHASDSGRDLFRNVLHGQSNPTFSLEIVGNEGDVSMFIRTPKQMRNVVESALYAHFPDIEIVERPDYTDRVPQSAPNKNWKIFGMDMILFNADAYPIKTYKYFQEEVTGNMIDPLANLLESLGTVAPGQFMWLQYIIRPDRPSWYKENAQATIDSFLGRSKKSKGLFERISKDIMDVIGAVFVGWNQPVEFSPMDKAKEEQPLEFRLSPGEKNTLAQLEENVTKPMFEVKCRMVLVGRKENFDKSQISSTVGMMKQFDDQTCNGFKTEKDWSKTEAKYIFSKSIVAQRSRRLIGRYRDRDPSGKTFHMSITELATIFHPPDQSVVSPSVSFVDSRRGTAPPNLPTH